MITTDTHRIRPGKFLHRVFDRIANESDGWLDRKDPCPPADHFFEDIVLRSSAHTVFLESILFRCRLKHSQHDACHSIDGESGANPIKRDALECHLKITERIDGHTNSSHFTLSQGVIGVKSHLGWEIEGHVEPGLTMRDHQFETLIGLHGCSKTCILTCCPLPASITQLMDPSCKRIFPGWR